MAGKTERPTVFSVSLSEADLVRVGWVKSVLILYVSYCFLDARRAWPDITCKEFITNWVSWGAQSGDMREGMLGGAAAADQANAAPTSAARPTTLSELLDVHQSPELHGHASQSGSGSVSTVIYTDEEDEWDQADI